MAAAPNPPHLLDVDAHGRVTPGDDATRRALADRAGRFVLLPSATDLLLARRGEVVGGSVPRPRCVLAGDLAGFPLVDFVAFVHQSRVSGVLTVVEGGAERSITFKDGEVRGADSSVPGERIGDIAVRLGLADAAQVGHADLAGLQSGRALVASGALSANDLWKCLQEQVGAVFQAILLAREGVFYLVDEDDEARTGTTLGVSTQSLLMDGIRRIDEMSLFKARIPSSTAVLRRREPRRPVTLDAGEERLLSQVDGHRSVAELATASRLNEFDATRTLFHLAEAGYVEVAADAAGSAAGGGPVEEVVQVVNELLRRIVGAAPADRRPALLEAVRAFLADPSAVHASLWQGLAPRDDGSVDPKALLERLAALSEPLAHRLAPDGDRRALALAALRELLHFHLFALGTCLPRADDDALAVELRARLAALDGGDE